MSKTTSEAVHAALDALPWTGSAEAGFKTVEYTLPTPTDSAPNFASTRHDVYGPARVTYVEFADGEIRTKVSKL